MSFSFGDGDSLMFRPEDDVTWTNISEIQISTRTISTAKDGGWKIALGTRLKILLSGSTESSPRVKPRQNYTVVDRITICRFFFYSVLRNAKKSNSVFISPHHRLILVHITSFLPYHFVTYGAILVVSNKMSNLWIQHSYEANYVILR